MLSYRVWKFGLIKYLDKHSKLTVEDGDGQVGKLLVLEAGLFKVESEDDSVSKKERVFELVSFFCLSNWDNFDLFSFFPLSTGKIKIKMKKLI